jgi:hypothetical protein
MHHSFKVMHNELYTVKVRVAPGWARWVGEKIWRESQKMAKLPVGRLEMTFRVAGLEEIKRWVLSFGRNAMWPAYKSQPNVEEETPNQDKEDD